MVDTAYERGAHALSGKLEIFMSAYQEAEILHLEIFATRQIRASVLATHEYPCLSCRRLALMNKIRWSLIRKMEGLVVIFHLRYQ